jgi:hypothetical protein
MTTEQAIARLKETHPELLHPELLGMEISGEPEGFDFHLEAEERRAIAHLCIYAGDALNPKYFETYGEEEAV